MLAAVRKMPFARLRPRQYGPELPEKESPSSFPEPISRKIFSGTIFNGTIFTEQCSKELSDPMKSKFLRSVLAVAVFSMISAWAQTGSAAPAGAGSAPASPAASPTIATGTGSKIGTINIEQALVGSNEGQRDFDALRKKLEPKQNELKGQNDELEALQKQLQNTGDKLNEDARANLVKQIETK